MEQTDIHSHKSTDRQTDTHTFYYIYKLYIYDNIATALNNIFTYLNV